MSKPSIAFKSMDDFFATDAPDEQDLDILRAGFIIHAKQKNVTPYQQDKLAVFAYNNNKKIIGGAAGFTAWGSLVLEMVWVDEAHRSQGLATRLIARSEAEALRRGCDVAYLWTAEFQAPEFYPKLGYIAMKGISLTDQPTRRTYFMKQLAA